MKVINRVPHYEKFDYKTFVVDNFVLTEPSDNSVILKNEYVLFETNLYKALASTKTTKANLLDTKLFKFVAPYSDFTPVKTVKTEPVKTEPVKTEPVKTEPVKTEPVKTEPVKTEKDKN